MKIEDILFPTDFSLKSSAARDYALYLAEALGSRVHILHAIEPLDYETMDEEISEFYRNLENLLGEKMDDERKEFEKKGIEAQTEIIIGQRWRVINNYAKEKETDVIVMGSHGFRTESGEVSVGTTSHKVMFTSPCPVLIVRHEMD